MGLFDIFAKLGGTTPQPAPAPAMPAPQQAAPAGVPEASMPAPAAPDAQPHGIAGFLSRAGHFLNDQDTSRGSSFADRLGLAGAHLQDISEGTDRAGQMQGEFDARVAKAESHARQRQLADMADQLNMTPREKFTLLTNPGEWAKAYAPHLIGGDGSYGTQTIDGVTPTGTLPESPHQLAVAKAADDRIAALEKWREEQLPILQQRANAASTSAAASATRAGKAKDGNAAPASGFDPNKWKRIK